MFEVLMVCTGNTCRSPMAAAIFQDIVNKSAYGDKIKVVSAGVSARLQPASKNACAVMAKRGLSLKGHLSRHLTEKQIIDAGLVLTMTGVHKQTVLDLLPSAEYKVFTLTEFAGEADIADISDPYGCNEDGYDECAGQIADLLYKSWEKIVKLAGNIE